MSNSKLLLPFLLGIGCATAAPPQELIDARSAYTLAADGPAQKLRPDSLHVAKVALDQAEEAYKQDPGSEKTAALAYVAERRAQQAAAEGGTAQAVNDKNQAQAGAIENQTRTLEDTQGRLAVTEQQLAVVGQQLAGERQARRDADKRAKEAMDKLALASVPVKEEKRGLVITLSGSVLFPSGKASLLPSAQTKLNEVAAALKDEESDHKIVIEGHTDARGSDATNQELSERRARAVREYLVSQGLSSDAIEAVGLGPSRPVADNTSPEGRANNRRVEIVVKPVEPK
jgi:outer membrane protein OmpA-like peptidoglycan-associated protein